MKKSPLKVLTVALVTAGVLNLTACGTLMHPERKGQTGGRVDAGVVALDAVGLLFWFIPGVIAFAVDFSNGTIYLPGGEQTSLSEDEQKAIVDADGKVDEEKLKALVVEKSDNLSDEDVSQMQVRPLKAGEQLSSITMAYPKPLG